MSTTPRFGTRDDGGASRAGGGEFIPKVSTSSVHVQTQLIQVQRGDRVHDALTKSSV